MTQCLCRIAEARRDGMVAGQPAEQEGQAGRTHRHDDFRLGVAGDVAGRDQSADGDERIGDAADGIGETVIVDACVAGVEGRMNVDDGASVVGGLPERREIGCIQHAADAAGERADHHAGKTSRYGRAQHFGRSGAILQGNGGQRHEARLRLGSLSQMRVDELGPGRAFRRREFVAEHVNPAADHLAVDAVLGHPGDAAGDVGERL
jgi:hypothetical protein